MIPLRLLIHGDWGTGKSWFAQTAPAPRLVLDTEGRAGYTYGKKIEWKNPAQAPPALGDWETCIAPVRDLRGLQLYCQWLFKGQHQFVSVILDSLPEAQKRLIDEIAGTDQLDMRSWGEVFRRGEGLVRALRDLPINPAKPVPCVVWLAGTVERGEAEAKLRPYVQGQLGTTLPGQADVVGLLTIEDDAEGNEKHLLYVHPRPEYVAKDGTHTFRSGVVDVTWTEEGGWTTTIKQMMEEIEASLAKREGGEV